MEGRCFKTSKFWIIRVDPGEDILLSLRKFIRENNIRQGIVVMGYGTLSQISLHWVTHNRFPPENRFDKWEGGIEILCLNGMIVDGEPHIHLTASMPEGAFGGHMEEGCICYVLCEIGIIEVEGAKMTREYVIIGNDSSGEPVKRPQLKFS